MPVHFVFFQVRMVAMACGDACVCKILSLMSAASQVLQDCVSRSVIRGEGERKSGGGESRSASAV